MEEESKSILREKEYEYLMKEIKLPPVPEKNEEWKVQGDFFVKFSLYKETSSGSTSSNTSYIKQ